MTNTETDTAVLIRDLRLELAASEERCVALTKELARAKADAPTVFARGEALSAADGRPITGQTVTLTLTGEGALGDAPYAQGTGVGLASAFDDLVEHIARGVRRRRYALAMELRTLDAVLAGSSVEGA